MPPSQYRGTSHRSPEAESRYQPYPDANPRYKGKNYDPNYHQRKNKHPAPPYHHHEHENSSSMSESTSYHASRSFKHKSHKKHRQHHKSSFQQPHEEWHQPPQQQQYEQPQRKPYQPQQRKQYQPQQQHRQYPSQMQTPYQQPLKTPYRDTAPCSDVTIQVLGQIRNELHSLLLYSGPDVRMCQCATPGGTECYHTITGLYQELLMRSVQLQSETAELLTWLLENDEYIEAGDITILLTEYLEQKPDSTLRKVLETMGQEGLVSSAIGAPAGSGVQLFVDQPDHTGYIA
ncbi:hypothetical protein F4802DRAFT_563746 [Xylaria palmicola]|nr:hypothetical protein F4802DRAFT_563746 [Xylaria palmicola]